MMIDSNINAFFSSADKHTIDTELGGFDED